MFLNITHAQAPKPLNFRKQDLTAIFFQSFTSVLCSPAVHILRSSALSKITMQFKEQDIENHFLFPSSQVPLPLKKGN